MTTREEIPCNSITIIETSIRIALIGIMAWVDEQPSTEPDLQQEDSANN